MRTSSRPARHACTSFACCPDEPRKMRGLSIGSSRQRVSGAFRLDDGPQRCFRARGRATPLLTADALVLRHRGAAEADNRGLQLCGQPCSARGVVASRAAAGQRIGALRASAQRTPCVPFARNRRVRGACRQFRPRLSSALTAMPWLVRGRSRRAGLMLWVLPRRRGLIPRRSLHSTRVFPTTPDAWQVRTRGSPVRAGVRTVDRLQACAAPNRSSLEPPNAARTRCASDAPPHRVSRASTGGHGVGALAAERGRGIVSYGRRTAESLPFQAAPRTRGSIAYQCCENPVAEARSARS